MDNSSAEQRLRHLRGTHVPISRNANSLGSWDDMYVEDPGNGKVRIDVYGTDPQGNLRHSVDELDEETYERVRADLLRKEQATLPAFSSIKSGNTVGRLVGETARSTLPAVHANPSIEAETEDEAITGEQILDGIQIGLDVIGLIPIVGEAADIFSAGISLARGDYVGAGLSLLSAIPFIGSVGTTAKATRHAAKAAAKPTKPVKQGTQKRATDARSEGDGAKVRPGRLEVKCFKKPYGLDEPEFLRQLKEQEDAINSLSAEKLLERRQAIAEAGSTKVLRDLGAQKAARKNYERKRLQELARKRIVGEKAEEMVAKELKELAATHKLDIIAGGDPSDISGLGDKRTNSSIGSQWKGARSQSLEDHAKEMKGSGAGSEKMRVKLRKC